jgi:hypothetical protein
MQVKSIGFSLTRIGLKRAFSENVVSPRKSLVGAHRTGRRFVRWMVTKGKGDGSDHGDWPVRAIEGGRDGAMTTPVGQSFFLLQAGRWEKDKEMEKAVLGDQRGGSDREEVLMSERIFFFCSFRSFHDLLMENSSSLFMLSG